MKYVLIFPIFVDAIQRLRQLVSMKRYYRKT